MKNISLLMLISLILILMIGCLPNFPQPARTGIPTDAFPTESQESQIQEDLSLERIRNADYILSDGSTTVTLNDGVYESMSSVETLRVSLLDTMVFADLDGDGSEDAVMSLVE